MCAGLTRTIFENEKDLVKYIKSLAGKNYWVDTKEIHCHISNLPENKYARVIRVYNADTYAASDIVIIPKASKKVLKFEMGWK